MKTSSEKDQSCKFSHLRSDRCHCCPEFIQNYFLHALRCGYRLRPEIKELLDEKEGLLKDLHTCVKIKSNPHSRTYKIAKKDEFQRISMKIREIERKLTIV